MIRHLAGATAMALLVTGAHAEEQKHDHTHGAEESVTLYRVFVGDHAQGRVTAFDLNEPDHRWTFDTKGQVKLYPAAGGSTIVAVQSFDDQVNFFTSGITLHSHGDHEDIEVADPTAIKEVLTGPRPFHALSHDGKVAINFDNGGFAEILNEHALSEGRIEAAKFPQARAHHGIVVPMGDTWISSVASDQPTENNALPPRVGAQEFSADGRTVGQLQTCTGLHGEALSGSYLTFGCKEGVLSVTNGADGLMFAMMPYPADFPEGATTGTLLGSNVVQMFLANYGNKGLSVIDPVDEPKMRFIELPFRRVDFVLDPVKPGNAYVLTEDGALHRVNMLDAAIAASAKVTEPYSMDGDWNLPRPRLAMAGDALVMTDPNAGLVRMISTDTLKEVGSVQVEGVPYNLTVVGGSGLNH